MRILIWAPPVFELVPGGHQVQMDKTAEALRRRGHDVVLYADEAPPDLTAGWDIVHGLGLTNGQVRAARVARLPVAASPIWWSASYRNGADMPLSIDKFKGRIRQKSVEFKRAVKGEAPPLTWLEEAALWLESCSILLPNGPAEAAAVRADTGVSTPMMTVPNGIDPDVFHPSGQPREGFVLLTGRVEPHKNQLGVIKALRGSGRKIVMVGPPHPHHLDYYERCREALEGRGEVLGFIPLEHLVDLYRRAAVHVLASWFETTGLANLEAAACETPVVSTSRGFARDYFGDDASYCTPEKPQSIARAVEAAVGQSMERFGEKVRTCFTWDRAAERTERAYEISMLRRPWTDLTEELVDA